MDEKVSSAQLEELVDYMVAHPMLAKGVGLGPRSKETVDLLWAELTQRLNARGLGAKKTGVQWKKKSSQQMSCHQYKVDQTQMVLSLRRSKTATLTKKDPKPQLEKRKVDSWVIELEEHRIAAEEKCLKQQRYWPMLQRHWLMQLCLLLKPQNWPRPK
ncbi:hypothetical protein EVAR_86486_1 [Eumeta japonica]|uniref:Regulatory protein zeste n=1 Tax=Eumeta variegata TaxID=151549 RepID=A0A4C1VP74_EUMVA|nr:hypothetical protein EVAR_86486_1 [Eumeta japonica]